MAISPIQLSVCNGCCCGHPEKSNPAIDRGRVQRKLREFGIQAELVFPYCLGPCHLANVVRVQTDGKSWVFGKVNTERDLDEFLAFAKNPKEESLSSRLRLKLVLAPRYP